MPPEAPESDDRIRIPTSVETAEYVMTMLGELAQIVDVNRSRLLHTVLKAAHVVAQEEHGRLLLRAPFDDVDGS